MKFNDSNICSAIRHWVRRGACAPALIALIALLFGCGATREIRREFGPWRVERAAGLEFRVPQSFGAREEGAVILHRPPGDLDGLPFIGVAPIPESAASESDENLLADFSPREHDPQLTIHPVKFTIHGRTVRGFESIENGVRGWTCIIDKKGRPVAALLIGVPAHWRDDRADAFRDIVLQSVKVL